MSCPLNGKDLLGFPYSARDVRNLSHDRLERRSLLCLLLFVQSDLVTEFPWIRHDGWAH